MRAGTKSETRATPNHSVGPNDDGERQHEQGVPLDKDVTHLPDNRRPDQPDPSSITDSAASGTPSDVIEASEDSEDVTSELHEADDRNQLLQSPVSIPQWRDVNSRLASSSLTRDRFITPAASLNDDENVAIQIQTLPAIEKGTVRSDSFRYFRKSSDYLQAQASVHDYALVDAIEHDTFMSMTVMRSASHPQSHVNIDSLAAVSNDSPSTIASECENDDTIAIIAEDVASVEYWEDIPVDGVPIDGVFFEIITMPNRSPIAQTRHRELMANTTSYVVGLAEASEVAGEKKSLCALGSAQWGTLAFMSAIVGTHYIVCRDESQKKPQKSF
jgi:hypothetical protein